MSQAAIVAALLLCLAGAVFYAPQQLQDPIGNLSAPRQHSRGHVVYVAEPQEIAAGKRTSVQLHFQVEDGYHINSHTPNSELLIPTSLTITPEAGVKASAPVYPAAGSYSFAFNPQEKLSVYTGDFSVMLPVMSSPGPHTIRGTLRYQACDRAACYPPRTLPIEIALTAN